MGEINIWEKFSKKDEVEKNNEKNQTVWNTAFLKNKERISEVEAKRMLDTYFRPRAKHSLSENMPENNTSFNGGEEYEKYLKEYNYNSREKLNEYKRKNPDSFKSDFIDPSEPNVGWKFHLSVKPENVKAVSDYLIDNGYWHKFLSGGDSNGKIFTIYIGSYGLAQKLANEISDKIGDNLAKPQLKQEIEFSRGVVGRFCSNSKAGFQQKGNLGLSYLNGHAVPGNISYKEENDEASQVASFRQAKELYGDYFFSESKQDLP